MGFRLPKTRAKKVSDLDKQYNALINVRGKQPRRYTIQRFDKLNPYDVMQSVAKIGTVSHTSPAFKSAVSSMGFEYIIKKNEHQKILISDKERSGCGFFIKLKSDLDERVYEKIFILVACLECSCPVEIVFDKNLQFSKFLAYLKNTANILYEFFVLKKFNKNRLLITL